MNNERPNRRIVKIIGFLVAALAPPALLARFSASSIPKNLIVTLAILAVYELLIGIIAFLSSIYAELKKRWTARLVEVIDAWLQRTLSRYTRAYLRHVRAANGYVDLKGLTTRGDYTLSLNDVFVHLKLESNALHSLSPDPFSYSVQKHRPDPRSIWFWLDRARDDGVPLAVIGPPGSGKTTLLKHVAFALAKGGRSTPKRGKLRKLPVLIALRDYKDKFAIGTPSLAELIQSTLSEIPSTEPPGWVDSQLRRNRFLVMLDGLDEIADRSVRQRMSDWTDRQLNSYPGISIVVTSRPFGYRDNPLTTATVLQVQPFAQDQVENFLKRWYTATTIRSYGSDNDASRLAAKTGYSDLMGKLEESSYLLELATNPLLLTMIANVHHYRGALPGSRSELYKEVCEVFLGKRHQARGIASDMPASQKQAVVQTLAFEMMVRQVRDVSLEDASQIISAALANVAPATSPSDFLRRVEESSGLLIEREKDSYSFAHLTFQEYLASTYIRDRGLVAVLVSHTTESWWRETIRLYSAQADATTIIESCLQEPVSNPYALTLAVECAEEGREVHPEVRDRLSALLSPSDARSNAVARRTAGLIRLMLRARHFRRIARDVFLSPQLINCIEYQAFLDDPKNDVARIPDHWTSGIYPEGAEEQPITGVRFSDALAFCGWLSTQFADNWIYRLPSSYEARADSSRQAIATILTSQAKTIWLCDFSIEFDVTTPDPISVRLGYIDSINDFREEVEIGLETNGSRSQSQGATLITKANSFKFDNPHLSTDVLMHQLHCDIDEANRRVFTSTKNGRPVVSHSGDIGAEDELELRNITCYTDPGKDVQRLKRAWAEINFLDLDKIISKIESIPENLYAHVVPSFDQVKRRLATLIRELNFSMAVAVARSGISSKDTTELREARLTARLCALVCGAMCTQLEESVGKESNTSRTLKGARFVSVISRFSYPRWLVGGHVMQRKKLVNFGKLADDFANIYDNLVILEGRINGRLPAWEGLAFVRSSVQLNMDITNTSSRGTSIYVNRVRRAIGRSIESAGNLCGYFLDTRETLINGTCEHVAGWSPLRLAVPLEL